MGTYRSTFIGPYLIVKDSITTNEIVEYFHPESGKKMKTKFDPNTGVEGVEKTRTESKTNRTLLYNIEVDGFREDEFFMPEYCGAPKGYKTWVCNRKLVGLPGLQTSVYPELDTDYEFNFDFTSFDMNIMRGNFISHYKDYFNKLKEMGIEFEICYGIVNYAH
jgi:hypothetical protein